MPSVSPAQHRLMEAVAHNSKFAAKVGIPQSVGKDYAAADAAKGGQHPTEAHKRVAQVLHGRAPPR